MIEDDMIGESIKIEESYQQSSFKSSSKGKPAMTAMSKTSNSTGKQSSKASRHQEDDSLDRDSEEQYSNEFIEESINS